MGCRKLGQASVLGQERNNGKASSFSQGWTVGRVLRPGKDSGTGPKDVQTKRKKKGRNKKGNVRAAYTIC